VQHSGLPRPRTRRNSSVRGRATTGPPPPLAGSTPSRSSATHRPRVSPIAFPAARLPTRARPRRRRARRRRRSMGGGRI
jgi:hypothetical protein